MSEQHTGPAPRPAEAAAGRDLPSDPRAERGAQEEHGRPEPLGVTVAPTGNADVDAAVGRLADVGELPTRAHIEVYEDVHRGLRDALAALDENRS